MTIEEFKTKLRESPKSINFSETMEVIESNYEFTPTSFVNGDLENKAGENSGSCKLFSFAKIQGLSLDETLACFVQGLSQAETLACFGAIYFEEVLGDPAGTGHQNIRNFMKSGFEGLTMNGEALTVKA